MKLLWNLVIAIGVLGLASSAYAEDPDCGYYDWENWDWSSDMPPFVFTGAHVPGETFSFSGSAGYTYSHTFDVNPDNEHNVIWQLKYCIDITDSQGREAVYGRAKYFESDGSGDFIDSSGDNVGDAEPLYVTSSGLPNMSDLNFYTYNDVGGADDYLRLAFWNSSSDVDVTISASWRPYHLTCE